MSLSQGTGAARAAGILALLTISAGLLSAPSAFAASTDEPTVEVRVHNRLACTGSVVAPRFILTASRCLNTGGRQIKTSGVLVVTHSSGPVKTVKVAGIDRAPKRSNGARPDLVLLQLRTAVDADPVKLPDSSKRARGDAKVSGWHSSRRRVNHDTRIVRFRRCGIKRHGHSLYCGSFRGRTPSRRCYDAAGAPLTIARDGDRILAGVGTRGSRKRGCRRRHRLPFEDLTRPAIRFWIASVIAPPQSAPSTGTGTPGTGTGTTPPPPGTPAGPLAPFVGTWSGTIEQQDTVGNLSYRAQVKIDRDGSLQQTVGSSSYDNGTPCGGDLIFKSAHSDGSVGLLEKITFGETECYSNGTITLATVRGQNAITYTWVGDPKAGRSDGVLARVG